MKKGKRMTAITQKIQAQQQSEYTLNEAFQFLKECSSTGFTEAVDVSLNLGIDAKKGDQAVRGVARLPNGLGKTVRVAVFTQADKFELATAAGADAVGLDDLAERIKKAAGGKEDNFDVVIATPDAMAVVGKLGTILGPKGLMPNPKLGTVTENLTEAISSAKAGQAKFRADKGGVVHATIGNLAFEVPQLVENFEAFIAGVLKAKPATAKGVYFKKVVVSSTMGPGLAIDKTSLGY